MKPLTGNQVHLLKLSYAKRCFNPNVALNAMVPTDGLCLPGISNSRGLGSVLRSLEKLGFVEVNHLHRQIALEPILPRNYYIITSSGVTALEAQCPEMTAEIRKNEEMIADLIAVSGYFVRRSSLRVKEPKGGRTHYEVSHDHRDKPWVGSAENRYDAIVQALTDFARSKGEKIRNTTDKPKLTQTQMERQKHRRSDGRYSEVNVCDRCGKSAPVDYCSDHRTDKSVLGYEVGCSALVLCNRCAEHLEALSDEEFVAELKDERYGSLPRPRKVKR